MVKCVKVPLKDAQKVKKELLSSGRLQDGFYPLKENGFVYFPVEDGDVEKELTPRTSKSIIPFRDALENVLSSSEMQEAKTAFDALGTIAIIEIPDSLNNKAKLIGETLLESNPTIKTVLRKTSIHDGVYRVQERSYLAGVNTQVALYKENGVDLEVNVSEVYFSVRLSTERTRISKLVKEGEEILVMFSGAAPYPCVFSKKTLAKSIVGVEINPAGHSFGLKNLIRNKIHNVELFCGDVRDVVPNLYKYMIGLKASNDDKQIQTRLALKPKVFEFYLKEEDIFSGKEKLIKRIKELKEEGVKVFLHMPVPNHHTSILGDEDADPEIEKFKILGEICKEYDVRAIIHITWEYPVVSKEQIIYNIRQLKKYYDYFYFENQVKFYATTNDILEISSKADIKNVCIDIAHLYLTYKDNDKILNHIKIMQKRFNTYFHLSDSTGIDEGLPLGEGNIDIEKILGYVNVGILEVISKSEAEGKEMIESYSELIGKQKKFDRIVMPLPKTAETFLDVALKASRKGTVIHLYGFFDEDKFEDAKKDTLKICSDLGYDVVLESFNLCGQHAPRSYRVCFDLRVK